MGPGYGCRGPTFRAVVIDYGVKRNILRELAGHGRGDRGAAGQREL